MRSAPPSPMPRRVFEDSGSVSVREQNNQDRGVGSADADDSEASMLSDFLEIMRGGVFVMARTPSWGVSTIGGIKGVRPQTVTQSTVNIVDTNEEEERCAGFISNARLALGDHTGPPSTDRCPRYRSTKEQTHNLPWSHISPCWLFLLRSRLFVRPESVF